MNNGYIEVYGLWVLISLISTYPSVNGTEHSYLHDVEGCVVGIQGEVSAWLIYF